MAKSLRNFFVLLLLATGFTSIESVMAETEYVPAPFEAHYQILRSGDVVGTATISLKTGGDGNWQFATVSNASVFLFSLTAKEVSTFQIVDGKIRPERYERQREMPLRKNYLHQNFNWQDMTESSKTDKKKWTLELKADTQDIQSHLLLLRRDLAEGKTTFSYTVSDNGKLRDFSYHIAGKETVTTPMGSYETVKVERDRSETNRQTTTWYAPALNFQPVRVRHIENGSEQADMRLVSLQ